jgi:glutamate-1-semialdehyde 2,1-aminomutase
MIHMLTNEFAILMSVPSGLLGWAVLSKVHQRWLLSRGKHASLTGHSRWSQRLARWIPYYDYGTTPRFDQDGAPANISDLRLQGFMRLGKHLNEKFPRTLEATQDIKPLISDMQFTSRYRVPYQYTRWVQEHLPIGYFWQSSQDVWLDDLDGNRFIDVTGSYGVNLFGYDYYKHIITRGCNEVAELGPVLGAYHPVVTYNVQTLCSISGLDEVSFHMSGTEAVMQAVRLARFHTRRSQLVRFSGAYHGWWEDVQPGPGNPLPAPKETFTLEEMSHRALKVLRNRQDIACVLVNPLQALHPNQAAPSDSTLVEARQNASFQREAYARWLRELREVCDEKGIALIFDEVFLGFRLGVGGAQAYFGVRADMVTYGKTLGGGLPVGVLCGARRWMQRFREDRPGDICFSRGTFNAHPYVMGTMKAFLESLDTDRIQSMLKDMDTRWNDRQDRLNERLQAAGVPVRVQGMLTVWTVLYTQPSRYHWMLQFYLRKHRVALSWVGTGRLIFSLNFDDANFDRFMDDFVRACLEMQLDGWWWSPPSNTHLQPIKRQLLKEMLRVKFGQSLN